MNEVISIICAEKSWKGVMLEPSSIDGFAMVAESQTNSTQILLEKLGILMGWRISTVKNFCVPIVRSPNTPKRSVGNFMENLRTWIGMGENKAWQQHSKANMANCGGGPQEKTSSNREEKFRELNKAEKIFGYS